MKIKKIRRPMNKHGNPDTSTIPGNYTGIVDWPSGLRHWYVNGQWHRYDGPAVEFAGQEDRYSCWYLYGQIHREDGPAQCWGKSMAFSDVEYFIWGHAYTEKEYYAIQYEKHKGTELGNKIAAMVLGKKEK